MRASVALAVVVGLAVASGPATASAALPSFAIPGYGLTAVVANGLLFDAPVVDDAQDLEVFDAAGTYVARINGLPDVQSLTLSPDGATIFAALGISRSVAAIDASTFAVTARYDVSSLGGPAVVTDVDNHLFVAGHTSDSGIDENIGVIDLAVPDPAVTVLGHLSSSFGLLAVLNRSTTTDEIYTGSCSTESEYCSIDQATYDATTNTATRSSTEITVQELRSLAVSRDGASVIDVVSGGVVELRSPDDLSQQSAFTGAPQGTDLTVTSGGILQAGYDSTTSKYVVQERSLDGALTYSYGDANGYLAPLATADDATLLISREDETTKAYTALTVRGGLRTTTAPSGSPETPSAAGMFVSTSPTRLLDTRRGLGGATPAGHGTVNLQITGRGPVPAANVSAVVLTVTATGSSASGYLTVYAAGASRPTASNLNFSKGQTVANLVTVPVSASGAVGIYNGSTGSTQVIADLAGYYLGGTPSNAGAFVATAPTRIKDTRANGGTYLPGKAILPLKIGGQNPVPASASSVVLNVTVTDTTSNGYLTAYPDSDEPPTASNLNFAAGQTVANLVTVPMSSAGFVDLYNGSTKPIDVIVDVAGYYLAGDAVDAGAFVPLTPTRLLDTRRSSGGAEPAAHGTVSLAVGGRVPVPRDGSAAVLMNITAVSPTASGYLTAFPGTQTRPTSSSINFAAKQTAAGLTSVRLGTNGTVAIYNGSTGVTQVVGDIAGYFLSVPSA